MSRDVHKILCLDVYGKYLSLNENSLIERISKVNNYKIHPCKVILEWCELKLIKELTFKDCQEEDKHYGDLLKHYEIICYNEKNIV